MGDGCIVCCEWVMVAVLVVVVILVVIGYGWVH